VAALTGTAPISGRLAGRPGWLRRRATSDAPTRPGRPAAAVRATLTVAGAARRVLAARGALRHALAAEIVREHACGASEIARARLRAGSAALSRLAAEICAVHGYRVHVGGAVPLGPVVLVANHLSYIDPLVLTSLVPCVPLTKREVSRWPLVGALGRAHGVVFVRRDDARSGAAGLLAARRALLAGVSVLNFPEGTTTCGEAVLPFRRGVFGLARRLRIAVVPIALDFDEDELCWTGDARFLPHYFRAAARRGGVVRVRFGCPMTPERYESADSLAGEARAVIAHMLEVSP